MPVYDRRYRGYPGERRSPRGLFWTLARFGFTEIFSSKLLLVLFIAACLPVVVFAAMIYALNNLEVLATIGIQGGGELRERVSESLFFWFVIAQGNLAFVFASFAGPTLVGPDLAHGAMPLYLSRPMGRGDYMLGKLAILGTLLSALTWIPGLLLVALQSALAGGGWLWEHLRVPFGIVVGSVAWVLVLSLLALAISAWIRWRPLATGALFGLIVLGAAFGSAINQILDTRWGNLLMFVVQMKTIWVDLLAADPIVLRPPTYDRELPVAVCWLGLASLAALAALLLHRKIRAHEVVS